MAPDTEARARGEVVLDIAGLNIRARSGEAWHPIVKDVSLTLHRGEILGLVGESGSGKTTIGLAALGFARAGCAFQGGAVRFKGRDLLQMPLAERRSLRGDRIAYVAQSAAMSFNPARTLMNQVTEAVLDRGTMTGDWARAEARRLFGLLQLPDPDRIGSRYPHELADRIMVLRGGRTIEEGGTRRMLADPQEAYTRSLWAIRSFQKQAMPPAKLLLEVEGISARYGLVKALDDVSVGLEAGRTVAVVGESGSGKSTLARAVTGLLRPTQGVVRFAGETLAPAAGHRTREQLRRLQIIHQSPDASLNPVHSVRETIGRPLEFFFGMRGARRDRRIIEVLEQVELGREHLDRLPGELSGGQKQRVCIGRALAAEPAVIICDEATAALDQLVQEEILKLLGRLQQEQGISYLFITHDIATVRAIADRIVVMHRGRVVQQGSRAEVLSPPYPAYTELLLSSVPEMDPDWLTRRLASRKPAPAEGGVR